MNESKVREIISIFNEEGVSGNYISTFLFLWSFGENEIVMKQEDIARQLNIPPRTLRGHLYNMASRGIILNQQSFSSPNTITINRFKHEQ